MVPGIEYSLFLNIYVFYVDFYQYFIIEIKFLNLSHYSHTLLLKIITLKSDLSFIWTFNSSELRAFVAYFPQIRY